MNVNRTTIFAALLAAGIATGAVAQSTSPAPGSKAGATAGSQAAPATPAPPSTGSTGMDKGAGTGAATGAPPASGTKSAAAPASSLSAGERRFIEKVGQHGKAQVEISKLAMDKAENPQAKDLAKQLHDAHTKANAELMKLASAKGVTIPADMDRSHKRLLDKLSKKSGNAFDREYTDEMEDDHTKEVREFRSMAKSAKDPDVKAFAASTLPVLEQHLQMAKSAESAVKGAAKKTTTAGTGGSTMAGGTTGAGPTGTAKSTATPGKDTAATTGTAGPGTGMPASSTQSTGTAPQAPGSASDTKTTAPTK